MFLGCEVDHAISEKHGGPTDADNLAYACVFCNRYKGTDIGSISRSGRFVRLFNPRVDQWSDHFALIGPRIDPLTEIGEVTTRLMGLNSPERLLERSVWERLGRYPAAEATARIHGSRS